MIPSNVISPAVLIDGEEKFLIHQGGYSFFHLKPGQYSFSLKLSDRYKGEAEVRREVRSNETHYLKVEAMVELHGFLYSEYTRRFRIVPVSEEIGQREIQECGYLDPAKSGKFSKSYLLRDN